MNRVVTALLVLVSLSGRVAAQDPSTCSIPGHLMIADFDLKRVTAAVRDRHLNIAVLGSGSTLLGGPDGPRSAYPFRLEAALVKRLLGVAIKVTTIAKSRETAEAMRKGLEQLLVDVKPDLVIWQTGTVDAIRGVEIDQFRSVLEEGIETVQAKQADLILINMQYSPRTESMIAIGPYADNMRIVAQQNSVLLFDRLSIMRHWSEVGQFDLYAASRDNMLARRVHDCIGRAIAAMIIDAGHLETLDVKNSQ